MGNYRGKKKWVNVNKKTKKFRVFYKNLVDDAISCLNTLSF